MPSSPKIQRSLGFQPEYSREIPTGKMPMLRLEAEPSAAVQYNKNLNNGKRGLVFPVIACTRIVWQMLLIAVEM